MSTLLHLDSSADTAGSLSRRLTARFADGWSARGGTVVRRDLFLEQPPHLPTNALHWAPGLRTAQETVAPEHERYQQELVAELLGADVVLIGAPMYNWSVPSTLKAWIDWIHVPGTTAPAASTEAAPLAGRPVLVVSARGGSYAPGSGAADPELAGLEQLFAGSMKMTVHPVLAELTLATRLPDLAPFVDEGAASLLAAENELDRLLALLG